MTEFVSIASDRLTASINPLGAELWSLRDHHGGEWLTDADPAFWTGHAPVLFPIVGALRDGRYLLDGREYALPKHGFARTSLFDLVEQDKDRATFRLTDSAETRAVYPFAFALDMAFHLAGDVLAMAATVTNRGDAAMPFSFGFHPAFAWPLPGGADKAAHRITFADPEPEAIRRLDPASGLVLAERFTTPVEGRTLRPDPALFDADALMWDRPSSRALSFGAEAGGQLEITFPDTPMLGIWQKPGAHYLCIEPWQGIADPVGFAGDFRTKPGVVELAPGAARAFRMDVRVIPG